MIIADPILIRALSVAAALVARIKAGEIVRDQAILLGQEFGFNRMHLAVRELGKASPISREDITLLSDHSVGGRRPREWWQES